METLLLPLNHPWPALRGQVGKRAVKQVNVTKIDVKSKKITLPSQRLGSAEGSKAEVTAKGQALPDLLTQLKHYSPTGRTNGLQVRRSICRVVRIAS
jgi:hypothetical protein